MPDKCTVNKEYFNCKKRTASLLVAAHSCGFISNYSEMITNEGRLYINRDYLLTTLMITDDSFRSCSSWKIS